jgi:hypothetical protein
MFAAEIEPADTTSRRRSPRRPIALDVEIGRGGLGRTLVRVVDISVHGARLQTYSALRRGSTIWLTLPGTGQHAADVMWADDFTAGCQFRAPLTAEQFAQLVEIDGVATHR